MDDHLEVCPACAAFDRAFRGGVEALRRDLILPSPEFRARLALRLSREPAVEVAAPHVPAWAATAAAVLLITLAGLSLKTMMVLPPPVAAEMQPMVVAQPKLQPGIPFVVFERVQPHR